MKGDTDRPVVLNLFSCQGGSAKGYADAGFQVYGVDKDPQPRYPFPFVQSDALKFLSRHRGWISECVDLVDASPPCQLDSATWRIQKNDHPDLIGPTRELILATEVPYVIENVGDAAPKLRSPVTLCGAMFPGLHTYRHRLFETGGWPQLNAPDHPGHSRQTVKMGRPLREGDWYHAVGNFSNVPYVRSDLKVPWMSREGIRECVPPAYTKWVGSQFLAWKGTA